MIIILYPSIFYAVLICANFIVIIIFTYTMIILVEIGSFAPTIPKLRMSNAMKDMAKIFVVFIFDLC